MHTNYSLSTAKSPVCEKQKSNSIDTATETHGPVLALRASTARDDFVLEVLFDAPAGVERVGEFAAAVVAAV